MRHGDQPNMCGLIFSDANAAIRVHPGVQASAPASKASAPSTSSSSCRSLLFLLFLFVQVVQGVNTEHKQLIMSLFDAHVDAALSWLKRSGKEFIPAVENNRTASLCCMLQSMLSPQRGFSLDKKPEEVRPLSSLRRPCLAQHALP